MRSIFEEKSFIGNSHMPFAAWRNLGYIVALVATTVVGFCANGADYPLSASYSSWKHSIESSQDGCTPITYSVDVPAGKSATVTIKKTSFKKINVDTDSLFVYFGDSKQTFQGQGEELTAVFVVPTTVTIAATSTPAQYNNLIVNPRLYDSPTTTTPAYSGSVNRQYDHWSARWDYTISVSYAPYSQASSNVSVSFNANGGTSNPPSATFAIGSTYGNLPTPTRSGGWAFAGWYTDLTFLQRIYATSYVLPSVTVLYAKWNETVQHTVTVAFDANGGTGGSLKTCEIGSVYGLNTVPTPTREGYSFTGWYYNSEQTRAVSSFDTASAGITRLYAGWKLKNEMVTVTFVSNGGSACASRTYVVGTTYASLPTPTRNEYTFVGWYSSNPGSGYPTFGTECNSSTIVSASVKTLYAYWSAPSFFGYVTLHGNGGTFKSPSTGSIVCEDTCLFMSDGWDRYGGRLAACFPSRDHYSFKGWYSDSSLRVCVFYSIFTNELILPSVTDLYCKWEPISYTISLDQQGGANGTETVTVSYRASPSDVVVPVKDGYRFEGYWTGPNGSGGQYYSEKGKSLIDDFLLGKNLTLYAKWTTVDSISIVGPDAIVAGDTATYGCQALFINGTTESVAPDWRIETEGQDPITNRVNNLVISAPKGAPARTLTLKATYDTNKTAYKTVLVKPWIAEQAGSVNIDTGVDNPALVIDNGTVYYGAVTNGLAVFKFFYFELGLGVTTSVIGSRPLVIESETDMKIYADIDVSGSVAGRCGGGIGGLGGTGGAGGWGALGGKGGVASEACRFTKNGNNWVAKGWCGFVAGHKGKDGSVYDPDSMNGRSGSPGRDATCAFGQLNFAKAYGAGGAGGKAGDIQAGGIGGGYYRSDGLTGDVVMVDSEEMEEPLPGGYRGFPGFRGFDGADGTSSDGESAPWSPDFNGNDGINDMSAAVSSMAIVAGSGGGGGAGGGGGGCGSGGSGGGSGSSGFIYGFTGLQPYEGASGGAGGSGGDGGDGGDGGNGGDGGDGGNGGGSLFLKANGVLVVSGEIDISAENASVAASQGVPGKQGKSGSQGSPGLEGGTVVWWADALTHNGGVGGKGGDGANGGRGGDGAGGGSGGYGAPGMVKLCGSLIIAKGGAIVAGNGNGDTADNRCGAVTFISNMTEAQRASCEPSYSQKVLKGSCRYDGALMVKSVYSSSVKVPVVGQLKNVRADASGICTEDNYVLAMAANVSEEASVDGLQLKRVSGVYEGFDQLFVANVSGASKTGYGLEIAGEVVSFGVLEAGETWTTCVPDGTSVRVKAVEAPIVQPATWTVTFDAQGGALDETMRVVAEGGPIGALPTATRADCRFEGWFDAKTGGTQVTAEFVVAADVTFYAHWTPVTAEPEWTIDRKGVLTEVVLNGTANLVIPDGVKAIDMDLLCGNEDVVSVFIPEGVTNIGEYAFAWCPSLVRVTIPASMMRIDEYAFLETGLEWEGIAFSGDRNDIDIAPSAFRGTPYDMALEFSLQVKDGVVIGFVGPCPRNVALPVGVTSIGKGAFEFCDRLERVSIPGGVTYIGQRAFAACVGLKELVFDGDGPSVDAYAFASILPGQDCTVYVRRDSTGWGVDVPGRWNGMRIEYVDGDEQPRPATYAVDYKAGENGMGPEHADVKTEGVVLKLEGAIFTRTGYVQAGWSTSDGGAKVYDLGAPYAANSAVTLYPFWQADLDPNAISMRINDEYVTDAHGSFAINLGGLVISAYTPKLTVKGLPAGLKYDGKAMTIAGTAAKPGVYTVTVSATNAAVTKPVTATFELKVPNLVDDAILVDDGYGPYIPGKAYVETIAAADGCAVTGLPSGMKWTAKALTDKTAGAVPANSVYGAATKPGSHTVYFTTTTADRKKHTATATFVVGPFPKLTVETSGNGTGKVTGAGEYAANKKVSLKATADTKDAAATATKPATVKSVFMGWYDGETLLSQSASYSLVMPETDMALTAKFITADEDKASIELAVNGEELRRVEDNAPYRTNVWAGVYLEWPVAAEALSATTVKVTGLPAGLKFAAKPVTSKVGSGKTAVVVTNVSANTIYGVPTAASKTDKYGNVTPSAVKVTVTTAGKSSQAYQIDTVVDALPSWAQGTFVGDRVSLTVSAAGKVSGKAQGEGLAYTLAAPYYSGFALDENQASNFLADVTATWSYKEGTKAVKTNDVVQLIVQDNGIGGYAVAEDWFEAYTVNWKVEPWKTLGKSFDKKTFAYAIREDGTFIDDDDAATVALGEKVVGRVTLKFAASGTVTIAGEFVTGYNEKTKKYTTVKATGSATLVPVDEEKGTVFIYLTPKGLTPHARCMEAPWPEG